MPFGVYKGHVLKTIPKRHLLFIKRIMNKSKSLAEQQPELLEFLNKELNPFTKEEVYAVETNDANSSHQDESGTTERSNQNNTKTSAQNV